MSIKINPDMETFFVGIAMVHGTNPLPRFGVERVTLSTEIAEVMANTKWEPKLLQKVRRNYAELGGKLLDTDPTWFYTRLADSYLDWLYGSHAAAGAEHPAESARRDQTVHSRVERSPRFNADFDHIFGKS